MDTYAGPRRRARPEDLRQLERAGWVAEEKADGCYCTVWIGGGGRVVTARYRSGAVVGRDAGRDLLGLATPFDPGSVLVGELMVSTPAAARWQALHGGVRGLVLFDLIAWGDANGIVRDALACGDLGGAWARRSARDMTTATQGERRAVLERLCEDLDRDSARVVHLVRRRSRRLRDLYEEIVGGGGEGVVAKNPRAPMGSGMRKVKRTDTITAQVSAVCPGGERVVLLYWGGMHFAVSVPRVPVTAGDMVDVASMGFYDSGIPRHARIVRSRPDLSLGTTPWV